ncbi:MAG: hypothetical protein ACRELE_09665 [Gemmatimonadales bacterium]
MGSNEWVEESIAALADQYLAVGVGVRSLVTAAVNGAWQERLLTRVEAGKEALRLLAAMEQADTEPEGPK